MNEFGTIITSNIYFLTANGFYEITFLFRQDVVSFSKLYFSNRIFVIIE